MPLFIYISIGLTMFYSSHFQHAVKIFFSLSTSFSHMGENYSCSGKHEQMSAVVARAYRRTLPQTASVNRRECSHSIQFNPNGKDRGDCTPALDRSYMPELRQSQYCWAISEITESSHTGWPWADLILSFTADPANVAGIMHCLSLSPAPISHRLA